MFDSSCDADPVALAKYVVALLRKEKPKSALRELCVDQLEVFLAKGIAMCTVQMFCARRFSLCSTVVDTSQEVNTSKDTVSVYSS